MDTKIVYSDSEPYSRFILFGYEHYYPGGGMGDVIAESDDVMEVLREYQNQSWDVTELYDLQARKEIDIEATLEANLHLKEQLLQKETA